MKLVCLNDVHLSHRGPQSRLDDWQETVFGKLDQVSKVAVKVEAKAVCIAGDLFHHKSRIAYGTVIRLVLWALALKQRGIDVLAIPGNHDEVHDRVESIPTQPLGLLFASGAIKDVAYAPVTYIDGDQRLHVVGVPYPDALAVDNFGKAIATIPDRNPDDDVLLMAHCFATPEGGTFFGQPVHRYGDLTQFPASVFHFGHDHSDHGVAQAETGQFFINIGALTRGSIAKDDVAREPKIALVDFGTVIGQTTVRQIKLKIAPAGEVFDLALKAQKDREVSEVEAFVEELKGDLMLAGPVSFTERLAKMNLPDVVRTRVQTYLDEAEASLQEM